MGADFQEGRRKTSEGLYLVSLDQWARENSTGKGGTSENLALFSSHNQPQVAYERS